MQVFIQRADSEPDPLGLVSLDDALELYRRHDWDSEFLIVERLRAEGRYCCSPSMTWFSDSGSELTIIPTSAGADIIYRNGKKHRFLGVIPSPAYHIMMVSEVPENVLLEILLNHYQGGKGLKDMIVKAGTPTQIWS